MSHDIASMKVNDFTLLNTLVSWNLEEDALLAEMYFMCPLCQAGITLRLQDKSYGDTYTTTQKQISKHLEALEDTYHAVSRYLTKRCPNDHQVDVVFVFGETQPARYVLVQAAIILRKY